MSAETPLTSEEKAVRDLLLLRLGARRAIPIAAIRARTGMSERAVKAAVEGLIVRHGYKVGSSRRPPYGYYLIETAEELEATCRTQIRQLASEARRVRALMGKSDRWLRELLGQMNLETVISD